MKQMKRHHLTTLHFSGTIDKVIKSLKQEEKYYSENYSNLKIDNEYSYSEGDSYYRHNLYGDKMETDEEESLRIKKEEESKKSQEEYQRRQYEFLRNKFEKNQ